MPALQEPSPGVSQQALQKKVDEISPRVQKLRGWDFKEAVPAGVHTPDQFLEFAREEFENEIGLETFAAMSKAYRLLGLIEPDVDLLSTYTELLREQVGGYYDPKTKTFYMISTFNEGALADIIMAHELTHALDDQYFDLAAMYEKAKGNSDREFAVRAVVEGSGTSLMNIYTLAGVQEGFIDIQELMQNQTAMMETQAASLEKAPPYLVLSLSLPYLEGNKFLAQSSDLMAASMKTPDDELLKSAFRNPPVSSEQVLHFEKYWNPDERDEPTAIDLADLSESLGEGWSLAHSDVLGEVGAFVITEDELPSLADQAALITASFTNRAATGWDGDRYQLYVGPDNSAVMLWASVWDSEKDQKEFVNGMNDIAYNRNAFLQGIEGSGAKAIAWFANPKGKKHLSKLKGAWAKANAN